MLQHRAAFCQPTHARLAYFVASPRSQFSPQQVSELWQWNGAAPLGRSSEVSS